MRYRLKLIGLVAALTLLASTLYSVRTQALQVPPSPKSGYVQDSADILSDQEEASLNQQIQALKDQSSNEIGIYTTKDLEGEDPAQFAVKVGRAWAIGTKDYNNGVIVIISLANPKKIFIGTGTGLEGALPDALAGQISRDEIAPRFKESKYYDGLSAGVLAISSATKGEYQAKPQSKFRANSDLIFFVLIFGVIVIQGAISLMASTKSWWLGGVFGGLASGAIAGLTRSFVVLVVLALIFIPLGLLLDYLLSKSYKKHAEKKKNDKNYIIPWYFGGGGSSGSGFGGGGGLSGGGFSGGGGFGGGGGGSSW